MKTTRLAGSAIALSLALFACTADDGENLADAPAAVEPTPPPGATPAPAPAPAPTPAPATTTTAEAPPPPKDPGGFVPGTFDPSKLEDLALWLRADKEILIDVNSDVVSWKDQSPNHNDATPLSTASAMPAYYPIPGTPGVKFAGKEAFTIADSPSLQWKGDYTLIVLAASSQPDDSKGFLFSKSGAGALHDGPALFMNYPTQSKGDVAHLFGGQLNDETFMTWPSQPVDDGTLHMFVSGRRGSEIFTSSAGVDPTSKKVKNVDVTAVGADVHIGEGFVGVIFEVVAVQHAITAGESNTILAYAAARYEPTK